MEFLKQRGIHCQILNQHGINKSKIKKDANIPEIKCGGGLLENKAPKSMKAALVIGFVARLHCGWSKLCALPWSYNAILASFSIRKILFISQSLFL